MQSQKIFCSIIVILGKELNNDGMTNAEVDDVCVRVFKRKKTLWYLEHKDTLPQ